jgi:hypothetical protein
VTRQFGYWKRSFFPARFFLDVRSFCIHFSLRLLRCPCGTLQVIFSLAPLRGFWVFYQRTDNMGGGFLIMAAFLGVGGLLYHGRLSPHKLPKRG